jgi:sugar/nucleoside kinase (ribokinase family)
MSSPTRAGVACAGHWIVEHLHLISHYPSEGEHAMISAQEKSLGGCACNVIRDLHDLDPDLFLYAIGVIGDHEDGHEILNDLHRRDIDTFQLHARPEVATAHAEIMISSESRRRTAFYSPGGNRLLAPVHFDFSHCLAEWLHLGSLLMLDGLDAPDPEFGTGAGRVLHLAKAAGLVTSIDLIADENADYQAMIFPTLPYVDFLIINAIEAARCCGIEKISREDFNQQRLSFFAERLLTQGVQQGVVIHFPEGALAMAKAGRAAFAPSLKLPPDQIRRFSGAGDAFAAAFIYATLQDWPWEKRLQLGHCTAGQKLLNERKPLLVGERNLELLEKFSLVKPT